jgi:hypothetical protein
VTDAPSGIRSVISMSRRNGSPPAKAGRRRAAAAGDISQGVEPVPVRPDNRFASQVPATAKKTTTSPRTNKTGSGPASTPTATGMRQIQVATSMRDTINTPSTETRDAVATASPKAMASTKNTTGQSAQGTDSKRTSGTMINKSASGGNAWAQFEATSAGRTRCRMIGNSECNKAKTKVIPRAHGKRGSEPWSIIQYPNKPKTTAPATGSTRRRSVFSQTNPMATRSTSRR